MPSKPLSAAFVKVLREYRERAALSQEKLADVAERIASLERIRKGLSNLIDACPGHGKAADCPILKALGEEESS